ncbi:MAG: type I-E CRISPR-associated protein Cas5/CasD [Gemmatimonadaceae bacterium]|nr:type I-E CRISPR-associated protein Cas5/CasD [Gemmatimonadaceae bacterium]MBA3558874.1 type I-E CRISPR-associated protein Cas5/CasD [Gemmatimonadaceae bacterium]
MTDFLAFRIFAPLASWGDIAVGEVRGSWDHPSRSAVLGMIAAGLGITRDDDAKHEALERGYGVAVRLEAAGFPLTDFHTAQTATESSLRKRSPVTRAEMLMTFPIETMISRRTYRQDALATVVVWGRPDTPDNVPLRSERWSTTDFTAALRNPHFVLYAGRKANVLGAPLAPMVIMADTLAAAFESYGSCPEIIGERIRPRDGWGHVVLHDRCDGFESGLKPVARLTRRDGILNRGRWQFAQRNVEQSLLPGGAGQ